MGVRWFPLVGWAERGGYLADGHGNSVPRFHVTWGTGPGVVAPFERRVRAAVASGRVEFIRNTRRSLGERLARTAAPHKILDPAAGPLIAVRLNIVTRKTLGGLQTDLSGRVLATSAQPVPGLYAAGEVAGFGGGGVHGYRSLEGTFLGGCLFSGRQAGRAAAADTAS